MSKKKRKITSEMEIGPGYILLTLLSLYILSKLLYIAESVAWMPTYGRLKNFLNGLLCNEQNVGVGEWMDTRAGHAVADYTVSCGYALMRLRFSEYADIFSICA